MSISCKSCGAKNLEEQKYCSQCGLLLACEQCGFTNDAEAQFCGGCGHAMNSESLDLEQHPGARDSILGFPITEILQDVAAETNEQESITLGSPKHLDQNALDDLFDV